jgi:Icc-related predicted phosphoesterase
MTYTLLCCTDTHNAPMPNLSEESAAAWVHAGDFYDNGGRPPQGANRPGRAEVLQLAEERRATARRKWLKSRRLPVYAVRGNHDVADPWGFFEQSRDITGRVVEPALGLFLAGIGWHGLTAADLPGEGELEPVCQDVRRQLLRQIHGEDVLVVVTHYPPSLPHGANGFDCIAELLAEFSPAAVVYGHLHEEEGTEHKCRWGDRPTLLINPGAAGAKLVVSSRGAYVDFAAREER